MWDLGGRRDPEGVAAGRADAGGGQVQERGGLVGDGYPEVDAVPPGYDDPLRRQRIGHRRGPVGIGALGPRHDRPRSRGGQQVDQDRLEQPAAPALSEVAALDDRVDHRPRSADGGEPQVGAVGLRVAPDQHRLPGQVRARARGDRRRGCRRPSRPRRRRRRGPPARRPGPRRGRGPATVPRGSAPRAGRRAPSRRHPSRPRRRRRRDPRRRTPRAGVRRPPSRAGRAAAGSTAAPRRPGRRSAGAPRRTGCARPWPRRRRSAARRGTATTRPGARAAPGRPGPRGRSAAARRAAPGAAPACRSGRRWGSGRPVERSTRKPVLRVERATVATRPGHGLAHAGAASAVGLDQPGPRQLRPGRADRGRSDREVTGRPPDRRQLGAGRQRPVVDRRREGQRDALGRAVVDGHDQVLPHKFVL